MTLPWKTPEDDTWSRMKAAKAASAAQPEQVGAEGWAEPVLQFTVFADVKAYKLQQEAMTWPELVAWLKAIPASTKEAAELIKLARFTGEPESGKKSCLRYDEAVTEICGIECDYDAEVMTPAEGAALLAAAGIKCVLVTTHSHTPEAPRWRVLAPTATTLPPDARRALVGRVNGVLGGVLARESFTLSQSYYIGPPVVGEYIVDAIDGEYIDQLDLPSVEPAPKAKTGGTAGDASGDLADLLKGEDLHGNTLRYVAKKVKLGLTDGEILALFKGFADELVAARGEERVRALYSGELQRMIEGAREKRFDKGSKASSLDPDTPFDMQQFSLRGRIDEMKTKMLDDKYVLGRIAILGQITAIYAKPNSGKTLLTLWLLIEAIKAGELDADKVFYINADDTYKGLIFKGGLAEKYGFHMIAPGEQGFKSALLLDYLARMTEDGSAHGAVIILDTLKKFTNIMDKKVASDFGKVLREFTMAGGTAVLLAHTNKNRDADGKVVASGTSDIIDDADCAYLLDVTDTAEGIRSVLFENQKQRGDVLNEAAYCYARRDGIHYEELLASVRPLGQAEKAKHVEKRTADLLLEKNAEGVAAITSAIMLGFATKTELIKHAYENSLVSKGKLTKALQAHTGPNWAKGHRWSVEVGPCNAMRYSLLQPPKSEKQGLLEQLIKPKEQLLAQAFPKTGE